MNNKRDHGICKICGNKTEYDKKRKRYKHTCCTNCMAIYIVLKRENIEISYSEILKLTSFLDVYYKNIPLSQRLWHVKNNNYNIQKCKICGNPTKYNRSYRDTCSRKCDIEHKRSEEIQSKSKTTCLKKYGVEYYMLSNDFSQKSKETLLKKYGIEYLNQSGEIQNQSQKTCLERYGVKNYSQTEEYKQKFKATCLKKYGVKDYAKTKEYKQKFKATCLKKYGVNYVPSYILNSPEAVKKRLASYSKYINSSKFKEKVKSNFLSILQKYNVDMNYEYLDYYKNHRHKVLCKKCNKEFYIDGKSTLSQRLKLYKDICPHHLNISNRNYSIEEKELLDYIESIYIGEILKNNRSLIFPYELDIYLPELKIAIEYNGLYWHSSDQKPNNYHKIKSDLCKEKGVHLIHIFENDWKINKSIVKSILSNFINNSNNIRIFARKCTIQRIDNFSCVNDFLINNHLLGKIQSYSYCCGLFYNNELVSLMTFKLLSKSTNQYELSRYSVKKNHIIIGGAEKLFKHFLDSVNYSSIITYNDNSIFKGEIYSKLGFQYIRTNAPNYKFFDKHNYNVISKQSIRKYKLGYKKEIEKQLGYVRIYNAGNDVYLYNKHDKWFFLSKSLQSSY